MKFYASLSCESSFAVLCLSEYVVVDVVMCIGGPSRGHFSIIVDPPSLMFNAMRWSWTYFFFHCLSVPLTIVDFILVCFKVVVCIVLRIIVYLYMSPFSSCLGERLSVPVHVCSSSPGKEVRSSLC